MCFFCLCAAGRRENPIEYQVLRLDDPQSLSESNFDAVLPTKIFIHGWNGNPREASPIPEGESLNYGNNRTLNRT